MQMEHDQSSYFCRSPDDFCWGPCPREPHPGDGTGTTEMTQYSTASIDVKCLREKQTINLLFHIRFHVNQFGGCGLVSFMIIRNFERCQ